MREENMAFFSSFTESIKQKWLQFFQANREWIILQMNAESVYTPDGGKRPSSYLILGVVNALEPKLAQLMLPFSRLNPDADTLVEVLDLHFDPDIVLGNRFIPPVETELRQEINEYESEETGDENTEDSTLAISYENSLEMDSDGANLELDESDSSADELGEFDPALNTEADDFGEISFDAPTGVTDNLEDQMLDDLKTSDDNAFQDVLSDVWSDGTLHKNEEGNDLLADELPSGVFDESEIARLFPNA
jgi:hypothetical protein